MKKVGIDVHNDYFDIVCDCLNEFKYEELLQICFLSVWHRKRILDYIFREVLHSSYDDVLLFKCDLIDCGFYNDYKKSILNGNDNFLKTCLVLYFENDLKDNLYKDNLSLAKTIVNCDEEYILILSNLVNVSQFICDDETIKYIKNKMSKVLRENLSYEDEDYLDQILTDNFNIIDENQATLKGEMVLKLNR